MPLLYIYIYIYTYKKKYIYIYIYTLANFYMVNLEDSNMLGTHQGSAFELHYTEVVFDTIDFANYLITENG